MTGESACLTEVCHDIQRVVTLMVDSVGCRGELFTPNYADISENLRIVSPKGQV